MRNVNRTIDPVFVEAQRLRLVSLRATLVAAAQASRSDEANVNAQRLGSAAEYEDDAQALDALERDANLVDRDFGRIAQVDRALKKIDESTYGLSDRSGRPIPRERLEAVPEALDTLDEELASENGVGKNGV